MVFSQAEVFLKEFAAKEKLEIDSGAAKPHILDFFAGGFRRRRRRNAFGLIQEYCKNLHILRMFFDDDGGAVVLLGYQITEAEA